MLVKACVIQYKMLTTLCALHRVRDAPGESFSQQKWG